MKRLLFLIAAILAITTLVAVETTAAITIDPAAANVQLMTANVQNDATISAAKNTVEMTAAKQAMVIPKQQADMGATLNCPFAGTADNLVSANLNQAAASKTWRHRVAAKLAVGAAKLVL
ncbi:MAG: hypothetical protein WCS85_04665 [Candidatus Peribacteraceae bacterium]